jgi:hypothetical protein
MILHQFKQQALFFNSNFLEDVDGLAAYRGELILIEGQIDETSGHRKPPVELMYGAILLGDSQLKMIIGWLDKLSSVETLLEKYQATFADDCIIVLYVINAKNAVQLTVNGIKMAIIPMTNGVPWNEISEELGLEKSDFKGQSAGQKVVTLYQELKGHKHKYPQSSLATELELVTDAVREHWGAV